MRKKIIAGNWKMNMTPTEAKELLELLKPSLDTKDVDILFCVPAIDLLIAKELLAGTGIEVGAQNMYFEEKGAYTGEISAEMLVDAGVSYVILGHSERRGYFKEDDEMINKKVCKAFESGIIPILCCGESMEQREAGITLEFIRDQIVKDLAGVTKDQVARMIIAYEPIWAIGTGKNATSDQAEEVCAAIRKEIARLYDDATAQAVRIQYGGSVKSNNAPELFTKANIDGALVGGASLRSEFIQIVNSAKENL